MQKDNSVAKNLTTASKRQVEPWNCFWLLPSYWNIVYLPLHSLYTCDNIEWDQLTESNQSQIWNLSENSKPVLYQLSSSNKCYQEPNK